jgi:hypothetical protein
MWYDRTCKEQRRSCATGAVESAGKRRGIALDGGRLFYARVAEKGYLLGNLYSPPEALGKDVVGCSLDDGEVVERRFKERVVICLKAFRDLTATTETLKDGYRRWPDCDQQRWEPAPASR